MYPDLHQNYQDPHHNDLDPHQNYPELIKKLSICIEFVLNLVRIILLQMSPPFSVRKFKFLNGKKDAEDVEKFSA